MVAKNLYAYLAILMIMDGGAISHRCRKMFYSEGAKYVFS